jgi:phosphoglycolate phosphatase
MTVNDPRPLADVPVDAVVFDLDGTLVDTAPDIARAVNQLLATHGIAPQTVEFVAKFIGEGSFGLIDKLYQALGLSLDEPRVSEDVETYLRIYKAHPVGEATLYADALDAIPALHAAGIRLGVCTNKAQYLAQAVLDHFGLARYFDALVGGDMLAQRKPHPRHLLSTLEQLDVAPEHALYIGDTRIDAECAQRANVRCLIVNWGTGPNVPVNDGMRLDSFADLVTKCAALNAQRLPGA